MITPILEELALGARRQDHLSPSSTSTRTRIWRCGYNVMSIPTLLVFKEGEVAKRLVGAKPKSALLQELSEFLPAPS